MRTIRKVLAIAVLGALPFAMGVARANPGSDDAAYQGSTGDLVVSCDGNGGVCFNVDGDEVNAHVTIHDATGLPVGAYFEWVDQVDLTAATDLGHGSFCNDSPTLAEPAGAKVLLIYIDELLGPTDCLVSNLAPGVGTTGTVHVDYNV
ncbi:MAG: hypothetical protein ABR552_01055 [Actinomycetota bacterium]